LNENAIHLFNNNLDKIGWYQISSNPNAISLLEGHQDKINWRTLSKNPNAISILEKNKNKIDWNNLMTNPSIFKYDYEIMKTLKADLHEEVIAKSLHPKRIFRLIEEYGEDLVYDIYFDEY
jgi:hypothetical protein